MYLLKHARPCDGWKRIRLALGLIVVLVGSTSLALAQETSAGAAKQELTMTDLLELPGRVVAAGTNRKAVGKFKVASYRVEEVSLPQATDVEIRGARVPATKAFRLTLIGGPFPVRAMPPVIWVDDEAVGYGVENEDLTEITVITYDAALLREAATLYLSYGDRKNKEQRVEVPEKLKFGGAKGGVQ
ncbi:MAG TPA: hypothetical protein VGO91_04940 [Pyrinomonadaceae bacterium]|jgi:hypothetical protein|nr:hypothetical protein [Pyrinomonadaceae bacterium]